jgi:hypothetical protein
VRIPIEPGSKIELKSEDKLLDPGFLSRCLSALIYFLMMSTTRFGRASRLGGSDNPRLLGHLCYEDIDLDDSLTHDEIISCFPHELLGISEERTSAN